MFRRLRVYGIGESLLSADPLEREIQRRHVDLLKRAGFEVHSLSQNRAVTGGLVNFPDVIAFRRDHTILIEEKKHRGKVRIGQKKFKTAIMPHTGKHLHYLLAPTDDELLTLINCTA